MDCTLPLALILIFSGHLRSPRFFFCLTSLTPPGLGFNYFIFLTVFIARPLVGRGRAGPRAVCGSQIHPCRGAFHNRCHPCGRLEICPCRESSGVAWRGVA